MPAKSAYPMKFLLALFMFQWACCVPLLALDVNQQPKRTYVDVSYGPEVRHVVDFWAAPGTGVRPLLVYIHGGGWVTGDKTEKMPEFQPFLDKGISCAAFNYRLTPTHPLPAPVLDAARAIQFLRSKAEEWNIDASRIALTGPSAGACTSMWLLLHDDLADPKASDPVLRFSTRVCAAAALVGQTSIDPKEIEPWLGPNVLTHRMIYMAVGEQNMKDALQHYDLHRALYAEYSPIRHVDAKDPPLFMTCSAEMDLPSRDAGHGIHHPVFGLKLKEASDRVGHECHLVIPGLSKSQRYADATAFLVDKLLAKP
jgi:acetyl esterase/lipase